MRLIKKNIIFVLDVKEIYTAFLSNTSIVLVMLWVFTYDCLVSSINSIIVKIPQSSLLKM